MEERRVVIVKILKCYFNDVSPIIYEYMESIEMWMKHRRSLRKIRKLIRFEFGKMEYTYNRLHFEHQTLQHQIFSIPIMKIYWIPRHKVMKVLITALAKASFNSYKCLICASTVCFLQQMMKSVGLRKHMKNTHHFSFNAGNFMMYMFNPTVYMHRLLAVRNQWLTHNTTFQTRHKTHFDFVKDIFKPLAKAGLFNINLY